MSQPSLERILCNPNLPTLPVVALRVLELTAKPEVALREIAAVVENDPAIATKVLRTVNSSFYALNKRCGSIQQALAFLGLQTVKALVLGFSLVRTVNGGGDDEVSFDFLDYWRRSIFSAAAAREIALMHRRCDPDEAFVSALVQDLGMVALWRAYGDRYLQIIDLTKGDHRRLSALEFRSLELDHTTVASELLSRWRFPEPILEAVRCQHRSHEASAAAVQLARTVELATTAAATLSLKNPQPELARFRRDGQEWFELRPAPLTLLLRKIANQAEELSRAFGLDVGTPTDVTALLKAAALIREEQDLPRCNSEVDACDLVDHATISVDTIADARAFGTTLEQAFLAADHKSGVGVLLVGIDRARKMQEAFGTRGVEAAMNHALHVIASIDGVALTPFRFVGAEIAVVLPTIDVEELCRVAELIRRKFADASVVFANATGGRFPATISVGAAVFEPDEAVKSEASIRSPDQLVRAAMFALANGRRSRNRVVLFHQELVSDPPQS